jgi:hypothetical protein
VTVLKIVELLAKMDPDRRDAVRDAIRGRVRSAVQQEVLDKISEAIEAAGQAGMTDEEIMEFVRKTLRKFAQQRTVANALKYRRHPSGGSN